MEGRYTILGHIAKGGMGSVYLGRVTGTAGFSRLVAIKRLHPDLAAQKEFVGMLVDEARLASQIRHTNVIDTLDLVVSDGAFSLVLEYVEGDSLSRLLRTAAQLGEPVPRRIALAVMYGVLRGLDAAHEARREDGQPLGIVHRDISPQNVLIGVDGIPRVIDFGVAKATGRFDSTRPGEVRGKFCYMAPEQMEGRHVTRQVDVYAAGVMLWELLVGRRLFDADDERVLCAAVLRGDIKGPSTQNPGVPQELDAIVLRATSHEIGERHLTARELLGDLERLERASDDEVGKWVRRLGATQLAERQRMIQDAAPAADGRPLEEIVADLGRSAGDRRLGLPRDARAVDESDTVVASTARTGLVLPGPAKAASGGTVTSRRASFVAALAVVGVLVMLGVLVLRAAAETRESTGGTPSALLVVPPPAPSTLASPTAPAASVEAEIEFPTTSPTPSAATPNKPNRARPTRPRPPADPLDRR